MCGIAGYLAFDGSPVSERVLRAMAASLSPRGPDGEGIFACGSAGLAHRRLAIIDPAAGVQPMANEDGSVRVTYNGEIYNHAELRRELESRGHRFSTRCDTEVVVHGYEEWGEACVERFRGMFAFAVLDGNDRSLLLARDRIGIKPLVYFHDDRRFAFASEIGALRSMENAPSSVDSAAVTDYLRHACIPAPRTIYHGIRKLPPGCTMRVRLDAGPEEPRRYWRIHFDPDNSVVEEEWMERLEVALRDAVRLRLMSDVPFGAFLSGGVDSSLVVALMAEAMNTPVKTFSIGFANKAYSELPHARVVAERYSTEHHEEIVEPDALAMLPEIVRRHGEPFGDSSAIPTHLVARLAASHVKMVLSGDGGDENFAGYSWYAATVKAFSGPLGSVRARLGGLLGGKFDPLLTSAEALSVFDSATLRKLLVVGLNDGDPDCSTGPAPDLCSRLQMRDFDGYLPSDILAKVDIATMTHGLEARVPFLDHRLVELCARIPSRYKLHRTQGGFVGKSILRKLAAKRLGAEFLARPKQGFAVPMEDWLTPPVRRELRARLTDPASLTGAILDRRALVRFLASPAATANRLWVLLVLDEWLRQNPAVSIS